MNVEGYIPCTIKGDQNDNEMEYNSLKERDGMK